MRAILVQHETFVYIRVPAIPCRQEMPRKPVIMQRTCALMCFMLLCVFYQEILEIQLLWLQDAQLVPSHARSRVVVSMTSFSDRIMATGMRAISSIVVQMDYYDSFLISIPVQPRRGPVNGWAMCKRFHDCIQPATYMHNASIISFLESHLGTFTKQDNRTYVHTRLRMTVQFLEQDYGPATKLLGALLIEKDPRTIIITVDDDITYDKSLIRTLATHTPLHAALCPACQSRSLVSTTGPKLMIHDASWHRWLWPYNGKQCPGWLVGWAGVAYRAGYFQQDVFNVSMPAGCFYNDDVWLSGYLRRKGISLIVMPGIRGGRQYRHPTLSLSVRPDYERKDMDPCIAFWQT